MVFSGVTSQCEKELRAEMRKAKVFEKDICETFVRSSGPGGQNVNKVSTCVVLKHEPSGLQVKVQKARTQGANRCMARRLLLEKIEKKRSDEKLKIVQAIQKKKHQTRKHPKALKEKILDQKHKQSRKKSDRQKIRMHKVND